MYDDGDEKGDGENGRIGEWEKRRTGENGMKGVWE